MNIVHFYSPIPPPIPRPIPPPDPPARGFRLCLPELSFDPLELCLVPPPLRRSEVRGRHRRGAIGPHTIACCGTPTCGMPTCGMLTCGMLTCGCGCCGGCSIGCLCMLRCFYLPRLR